MCPAILDLANPIDGYVKPKLGRAAQRISALRPGTPSHFHVDVAGFQFIQHLIEAFQFGFFALGSIYPAEIVVALIPGTLIIAIS